MLALGYDGCMLSEWLQNALKAAGKSQSDLARHLTKTLGRSIDRAAVNKMLSGLRKLAADELIAAAGYLGIPAPMGSVMLQIAGKAGAGPDGSVLFARSDEYLGEVPAPANATAATTVLEVAGDSMRGMANDGWLIFYDERVPPSEEHIGEPCVCWLENDRVVIKTPYFGRLPGLYDLESQNAETMRDVAVRDMALVTNIVPRRSAQKFIRRHPNQPFDDVKVG